MINLFKGILFKLKAFFLKYIIRKKHDFGLFYMDSKLNLGDSITPIIVENTLGRILPVINPQNSKGDILFAIGSILKYANSDSIIWGSGFMSVDDKCKSKPSEVLAVRGPRTAHRLKELYDINVDCFGDPAILLPLYYPPPKQVEKKFDFGIIPHYIDKSYLKTNKSLLEGRSYIEIDIETNDVNLFIDQLLSCKCIYSSTLHGIIIGESYGVPVRWLQLTDRVVGGGFKFHDYYESTGRNSFRNYQLDDVISFELSKKEQKDLNNKLLKMSKELLNSIINSGI